jgi:putative NADH-flavin reductase
MSSMNIVVVGAAGGIGRHVAEQALEAGHRVTAFVRDPGKLTLRHERLAIVRGDVLDSDAVRCAIAGHDAVVCAIGTRSRGATTLYSDGARIMLAAMAAEGIRRYIGISASGFHRAPNDTFFMRFMLKPLVSALLKGHFADLARMESIVRASDRDWTIVAPPQLTDGPRTGRYRESLDVDQRNARSISRADVADYIVRHLAKAEPRPALAFTAY